MKFFIDKKVRRPIGAKILGITFILLILMGIVTYTSNSNLKKLNEELSILSGYYIPLDQALGDLRMNYTAQIFSFERVIASHPKKGLEAARQESEKLAQGMPFLRAGMMSGLSGRKRVRCSPQAINIIWRCTKCRDTAQTSRLM